MRMGLRYVRGLREEAARALVSERNQRPFTSVDDLARRVPELRRNELNMLAQIGALNRLGGGFAGCHSTDDFDPEKLNPLTCHPEALLFHPTKQPRLCGDPGLGEGSHGMSKIEMHLPGSSAHEVGVHGRRAISKAFKPEASREILTEPPAVAGGPQMAEWPAPGKIMLYATSRSAAAKHAAAPPPTTTPTAAKSASVGGPGTGAGSVALPQPVMPVRSQRSRVAPRTLHRRDALWQVERAAWTEGPLLADLAEPDSPSPLAQMTAEERLVADYHGTGMTVGPHPMVYRREEMTRMRVIRATDLQGIRHGQLVRIAGCVIARQRPGTANGFIFLSLEDETGISNAIITPDLYDQNRLLVIHERFLLIEGILQNVENVISVKAMRVAKLEITEAATRSHDFH
jgi:hypothetical protein